MRQEFSSSTAHMQVDPQLSTLPCCCCCSKAAAASVPSANGSLYLPMRRHVRSIELGVDPLSNQDERDPA